MQNVIESLTPDQAAFLEWSALPKKLRQPTTQAKFAEKIGVDQNTLTRWKKLEGFRLAAAELAREYLGDDLPEIYAVLAKEAKRGSFQHIKLALEVSGEYVEHKDITSGGKPISSPVVYLPAVAGQDSEQGE